MVKLVPMQTYSLSRKWPLLRVSPTLALQSQPKPYTRLKRSLADPNWGCHAHDNPILERPGGHSIAHGIFWFTEYHY